jgi:hypothetical protein
MEFILACLIIGIIASIVAWKYFSSKEPTVLDAVAPYKVEDPAVTAPAPVVEPVVESVVEPVADVAPAKPVKTKAKKQKAPAVVAEAVVEPVEAKRTKSKKT